jgi:hypothetical protein
MKKKLSTKKLGIKKDIASQALSMPERVLSYESLGACTSGLSLFMGNVGVTLL